MRLRVPFVHGLLYWSWRVAAALVQRLPARRPLEYRNAEFFHPAFLYESLWDLAVFVALVYWLRPRWHDRPGALAFWYIGFYSVGRFAIEAVRVDSFWVGGYRVPQIVSLAGVIVSVFGLLWVSRRAPGAARVRRLRLPPPAGAASRSTITNAS